MVSVLSKIKEMIHNDPKPGIHTTEFWLTAGTNIAVAVIPIALAIINYAYISSRGKVKSK